MKTQVSGAVGPAASGAAAQTTHIKPALHVIDDGAAKMVLLVGRAATTVWISLQHSRDDTSHACAADVMMMPQVCLYARSAGTPCQLRTSSIATCARQARTPSSPHTLSRAFGPAKVPAVPVRASPAGETAQQMSAAVCSVACSAQGVRACVQQRKVGNDCRRAGLRRRGPRQGIHTLLPIEYQT